MKYVQYCTYVDFPKLGVKQFGLGRPPPPPPPAKAKGGWGRGGGLLLGQTDPATWSGNLGK